MTDENALQAEANPGAVLNEVGAIARRLVEGLFQYNKGHTGRNIPVCIKEAFESVKAIDIAHGRPIRRMKDPDADLPFSYHVLARYLGRGNPPSVIPLHDPAHLAPRCCCCRLTSRPAGAAAPRASDCGS